MGQKILVYFTVFALLTYIMGSCANTTTPPMGGPKDTIPPVMLSIHPAQGSVGIPVEGATITLKFDEFIAAPLKNATNEIYISPPLERRVVAKVRGKSVILSFDTPLDSSTTYILNLGNSIVDNNDGNQFPPYTVAFSTGAYIDSMLVSGYVLNAETLMPQLNVKMALYEDHSDSVVYNSLPSALAKTDSAGYFLLRNIPAKNYTAFAFSDENNNNKYDPDNEMVAFLDSLIYPTKVVRDNMAELARFNSKDSTAEARPADLTVYMFKEDPFVQFIRESSRSERRRVEISFGAPKTQLISAIFEGVDSAAVLREFSPKRDTLNLWIADTTLVLPDTLKLSLSYYKTDSLRQLSPATDELKLVYNKKDTLKSFNPLIKSDPSTIKREGFAISLSAPIAAILHDSIRLESANIRKEITSVPYNIVVDTTSYLKYRIFPESELEKGFEYTLVVSEGAFTNIYGLKNSLVSNKISLPQDPKLSTLILDISAGVEGRVRIDLMDEKRQKIFGTYDISGMDDAKLEFPYITAGNYSVRIAHDRNGNGVIDTGSIKERRQPEKVVIYTLSSGKDIIIIGEGMDIEQSIDLKSLFQ